MACYSSDLSFLVVRAGLWRGGYRRWRRWRESCYSAIRAADRTRRCDFHKDLFQATLAWMNGGGKKILPSQQLIDFRRTFDRGIQQNDRLLLPILLSMDACNPLRSLLSHLAQKSQRLLMFLCVSHAHFNLLIRAQKLFDIPLLDQISLAHNRHP